MSQSFFLLDWEFWQTQWEDFRRKVGERVWKRKQDVQINIRIIQVRKLEGLYHRYCDKENGCEAIWV